MLKHTLAVVAALTLALTGCGTEDTGDTGAGADTGAAPSSPRTGTTDSASATAVSFTVEGGERVSGPEQLEVAVGETVAIEVTSDTADELHVHGYNKTVALTPGEPATLEFEAGIAGVWEIELHDSGALLTELRVTP